MAGPRRIRFVTGARSELEYLRPALHACRERKGLDPAFIVCGGHLSPFHGRTAAMLREEGEPIAAEIDTLLASDTPVARSLSFANVVEGLTRSLARDPADVLMVAGDREEPLAAAMVGNMLGIPVGHIHGGDRCIASDIDEVLRPAISKLAHLHFTATEGHRERLIRMGEREDHVWAVGAVSLDGLRTAEVMDRNEIGCKYGLDTGEPWLLLIHHPLPTMGEDKGREEMRAILETVEELGVKTFCGLPNFDPGSVAIREEIERAAAESSLLEVYRHLPREEFYGLYRGAAAVVGNSSSIVIESGFWGVPGVLVGDRQNLRDIGPNVVRVPGKRAAIAEACRAALKVPNDLAKPHTLYGDGHAAGHIADVLETIDLPRELLWKTLPY